MIDVIVDILNNGRCYGIEDILNNGRCYGTVDILNNDRCYGTVDILNNDRCHGTVDILNNDRCHHLSWYIYIVDVVNYDRCYIYKVCNRRTEQCLRVASWIILFDSLSCMSHSCNTRPPYRVCRNVSSKWNASDSVIYNSRYTFFLLIYIATIYLLYNVELYLQMT